jgi:translocator protein
MADADLFDGTAALTKSVIDRSWQSAALFSLGVVGGGLLIGATNLPGTWYRELRKPALNPPSWVFGPTWTALYVLIAVAGGRTRKTEHFKLWALQMALNFAWSPAVFRAHRLDLGFGIILAMLGTILQYIRATWDEDRVSAMCFVPYASWVSFATYLNAGLLWLN